MILDKVLNITNLKLLQENTGENLHVIGLDSDFFDMTPKYRQQKQTYTKGTTSKLKTFLHQKTQLTKMTYGVGENICKSCI